MRHPPWPRWSHSAARWRLGLGGVSASRAGADLAEKIKRIAADELEASAGDIELQDGAARIVGTATATKPISIEYALERLPQCRGNVGGCGPAWNITGFYSENGAPAKTFEVTKLADDGKDRVASPGRIVPSAGGDLAIWFQVTSSFGCSEYDSAFGQNYHLSVGGISPRADATIAFGKDGNPVVTGAIRAGAKVKVHYEQDRLPDCRRTQAGNPVWAISGFSQIDNEDKHSFDTAIAQSGDRKEVDAYVDLPHSGKLSLWFQVVDIGGCNKYDSNEGANYVFTIEN